MWFEPNTCHHVKPQFKGGVGAVSENLASAGSSENDVCALEFVMLAPW